MSGNTLTVLCSGACLLLISPTDSGTLSALGADDRPAVTAGVATRSEVPQARRGGGQRRDPKEFTMLNDDGFPLNVDPKIVAATREVQPPSPPRM